MDFPKAIQLCAGRMDLGKSSVRKNRIYPALANLFKKIGRSVKLNCLASGDLPCPSLCHKPSLNYTAC